LINVLTSLGIGKNTMKAILMGGKKMKAIHSNATKSNGTMNFARSLIARLSIRYKAEKKGE
jgi:chemotaxis receptor (MCP) glutamine deamidase CheD